MLLEGLFQADTDLHINEWLKDKSEESELGGEDAKIVSMYFKNRTNLGMEKWLKFRSGKPQNFCSIERRIS